MILILYGRSTTANLDLCFNCQSATDDVLRSSNDELNTLATNISKFNELGRLKFEYSRIANKKLATHPERGHLKSTLVVKRGEGGARGWEGGGQRVLKKQTKTNSGRWGQAYLYVRSVKNIA